MTQPSIGHGLKFERSDDGTSGGAFATVGEVIDLTPPSISRDPVEVTHTESPEGYREFIGGLKDAGEASIDLHFDPAHSTTAEFFADIGRNEPSFYKIVFPDGTEWGFPALATGYEPGAPLDDKMTATFTVKLTGKPGFVT